MGLTRDIVIDKTPELIWTRMSMHDYMLSEEDEGYEFSRGKEIDLWLEAHPECTNFVIIDDRCDFTEEQEPHFVHVNRMYGLSDDNTDIAIMILNHH